LLVLRLRVRVAGLPRLRGSPPTPAPAPPPFNPTPPAYLRPTPPTHYLTPLPAFYHCPLTTCRYGYVAFSSTAPHGWLSFMVGFAVRSAVRFALPSRAFAARTAFLHFFRGYCCRCCISPCRAAAHALPACALPRCTPLVRLLTRAALTARARSCVFGCTRSGTVARCARFVFGFWMPIQHLYTRRTVGSVRLPALVVTRSGCSHFSGTGFGSLCATILPAAAHCVHHTGSPAFTHGHTRYVPTTVYTYTACHTTHVYAVPYARLQLVYTPVVSVQFGSQV